MSIERTAKRFLRRLRRHSSGAAAVEFALIAPVLAGLLLPMVDFGIGAYEKMRVESAAEAGAQYALANASSYSASLITTAVQSATTLASVAVTPNESCNCITNSTIGTAISCTSTCADGSTPGTFISVATQVSYIPMLSYPGVPNPMTLNGYAVVRVQ